MIRYSQHPLSPPISFLSTSSPRFASLNMAICSLIEDYGLVGFETLAVEDKESMLHLMRAVDKATGCIFVPSSSSSVPEGVVDEREKPGTTRPNAFGLFASAMGPPTASMKAHTDPRIRPLACILYL